MDEKRYDVDRIKERLYGYRESARDLETQQERLEKLKTKMLGVGAQTLTDMPKAKSQTADRLTDLLQQKDEIEESIRDLVESRKKERKFIEGVIKHLRKSDERSVIRVRYIDNESWDGVVDVLFGAREDLLEKADIYMRRVYKLHGEALLSMAKYIEESGLVWEDPDNTEAK